MWIQAGWWSSFSFIIISMQIVGEKSEQVQWQTVSHAALGLLMFCDGDKDLMKSK